jgi:hypothetical protein
MLLGNSHTEWQTATSEKWSEILPCQTRMYGPEEYIESRQHLPHIKCQSQSLQLKVYTEVHRKEGRKIGNPWFIANIKWSPHKRWVWAKWSHEKSRHHWMISAGRFDSIQEFLWIATVINEFKERDEIVTEIRGFRSGIISWCGDSDRHFKIKPFPRPLDIFLKNLLDLRKYYETRLSLYFWSDSSTRPSESNWEELMFVAFNCCALSTNVWYQSIDSLKEWSSCLVISKVQNPFSVFELSRVRKLAYRSENN